MPQPNAPKEELKAEMAATKKVSTQGDHINGMDKKHQGLRMLKKAGLKHHPLSTESDIEKKAEIQRMDVALPVENFERSDIRQALYRFIEFGIIESDDVPPWVDSEANGQMLYGFGWREPSLRGSVKEWKRFIKENE